MTETAPIDIGSTEFKTKETDYFSWFLLAHHSALKPHYDRGEVLGTSRGKSVEARVNKVTPHCAVAGAYADLIIDTLSQTGSPEYQLDGDEKKETVDATILHDWRKKKEIDAIDGAKRAGTFTYQTLEEIKATDATELREMGIPDSTIALTGANVPKDEQGPTDFREQVIWYVDAMLSITDAVPIGQRFDDLDRGWTGEKEDPVRAARSKAFSEMFKPKYNGTPLFNVQRGIATRLNDEFARALQYEGNPDDLPLHFKQILHVRIVNFQHPHKEAVNMP